MTLDTSLGTTPTTGSDTAAGTSPAGSGSPLPAGRRTKRRIADWRKRVEIAVLAGSELVGRTIAESGLLEMGVQVLTLHRGTRVTPNPGPGKVLEEGDRLLCFGRHEVMRSLIPARSRRPKRVRRLPKQPIHDVPGQAEALVR